MYFIDDEICSRSDETLFFHGLFRWNDQYQTVLEMNTNMNIYY